MSYRLFSTHIFSFFSRLLRAQKTPKQSKTLFAAFKRFECCQMEMLWAVRTHTNIMISICLLALLCFFIQCFSVTMFFFGHILFRSQSRANRLNADCNAIFQWESISTPSVSIRPDPQHPRTPHPPTLTLTLTHLSLICTHSICSCFACVSFSFYSSSRISHTPAGLGRAMTAAGEWR